MQYNRSLPFEITVKAPDARHSDEVADAHVSLAKNLKRLLERLRVLRKPHSARVPRYKISYVSKMLVDWEEYLDEDGNAISVLARCLAGHEENSRVWPSLSDLEILRGLTRRWKALAARKGQGKVPAGEGALEIHLKEFLFAANKGSIWPYLRNLQKELDRVLEDVTRCLGPPSIQLVALEPLSESEDPLEPFEPDEWELQFSAREIDTFQGVGPGQDSSSRTRYDHRFTFGSEPVDIQTTRAGIEDVTRTLSQAAPSLFSIREALRDTRSDLERALSDGETSGRNNIFNQASHILSDVLSGLETAHA